MYKDGLIQRSLRDRLLEDITDFLLNEGFQQSDVSRDGIVELANLISDYYEEGQHLFPEVILTNDISIFKTIPSYIQVVGEEELSIDSFRKIMKRCAPLSKDGWIIYLEIKEQQIAFGLVTLEVSETSLPFYEQTGNGKDFFEESTLVYIRSVGQKRVEISGLKRKLLICLSLDENIELGDDKVSILAKTITSDLDEAHSEKLSVFIEKLIDKSLKVGHGNLIGVVADNLDNIEAIRRSLDDGVYLDTPIDFGEMIKELETEKSNELSVKLRLFSSLATAMLNHDGITLFTTAGKLIGYQLFIKDNNNQNAPKVIGGARSRAFEAMKNIGLKACFYKSQDGNTKLHIYE